MDKSTIFFQVYRQPITNPIPARSITLDQFLEQTKNPPQGIIDIFDQIAAAEFAGDQELKAKLKQTYLYYFTPCVKVLPFRRYECIKGFTGLLILDFDHIDNAQDFKYFLFEEYRSIIAVYLSPSKRGVKCLVKIPIVTTVDEFKEFYYGIAEEMQVYNGFDSSGQNAVLPLFQSYDPDLLSRDAPETWTIKGMKYNDLSSAPVQLPIDIYITDRDKQTVINIIHTGFNNITDCGHPPLRSLCIAIGGYIASGYIEYFEAIQIVNYRIETHGYLKKGINGYKKTAQWAINEGQRKPLTLMQLV